MGRAKRNGAERPAYLTHWGLKEPPFALEPDPRFAYERGDHREAMARVLFGLTQLGGLVLITGEIGCGKTTLTQTLRGLLTGAGMRIAEVPNPPRTGAATLAAVYSAATGTDGVTGTAARLSARLREHAHAPAADGRRLVIVVDEAQRLDARALDELRMLTNPEGGPGIATLLLGQPELSGHVARQPQVAQRVVVRYHLRPMGADEVDGYVQHRTRVAGAGRRLFTGRASAALHAATGGVPRLVNLLGANALFVAATRGEDQIGADTIHDVADDRTAAAARAEGTA
ncbi:MAG: AAA family ATPase [Thermoleophilia bacterium]